MNLALNPFEKGRKPELVDEVEVSKELEEQVEDMFKIYKVFRVMVKFCNGSMKRIYEYTCCLDDLVVLPPLGIYLLSNKMQDHGEFLTRLIQMSYDAGYNDFMVRGLEYVGINLQGRSRDRIRLHMDGEPGQHLGDCSNFCNFYADNSDGSTTAFQAFNSRFFFKGNCNIGYRPTFCYFDIGGKVSFQYQYPDNCIIRLKKKQDVPEEVLKFNKVIFR